MEDYGVSVIVARTQYHRPHVGLAPMSMTNAEGGWQRGN